MGYSEITNYEGTSPETKVSLDVFESQFIVMHMRDSLVSEISSFSHQRGKTFYLFPTNLANLGNLTRNNVSGSATMFPSLTRPVKLYCFLQQKEERDRSKAETKSEEKSDNTEKNRTTQVS